MSELDQMRLALAEALGEDPENIQSSNPRWLELMKEGVLVSLHIGRWRAKSRLTWHDLGIEVNGDDEELIDLVDLGQKRLLPTALLKKLEAVESGARKYLNKAAYRTYWGHFVPVTAYAGVKEKLDEYRARYFAIRDEIVSNYDALIEEVIGGYRAAAKRAYHRLSRLHPGIIADTSEEGFVEAFVDNVRLHLKSAEEIRRSFYFEVELHYVPLPSLMAEEWAEKERIEAQAAAERERQELELQAERDRAWAEREKLRAEVQAARSAAAWKEQLMREMHRDVVETARRQKEELVDGFLRDVVVQLRSLVYEAATDVLAAIQRNDRLPPASIKQLRNLVTQVGSLNFYGDADIEAMIARVREQLPGGAQYPRGTSHPEGTPHRTTDEIRRTLVDIATVTRASLIGLGERPRQARSLGVADVPTDEMVRQARRGLGLPDQSPTGGVPHRQSRLAGM